MKASSGSWPPVQACQGSALSRRQRRRCARPASHKGPECSAFPCCSSPMAPPPATPTHCCCAGFDSNSRDEEEEEGEDPLEVFDLPEAEPDQLFVNPYACYNLSPLQVPWWRAGLAGAAAGGANEGSCKGRPPACLPACLPAAGAVTPACVDCHSARAFPLPRAPLPCALQWQEVQAVAREAEAAGREPWMALQQAGVRCDEGALSYLSPRQLELLSAELDRVRRGLRAVVPAWLVFCCSLQRRLHVQRPERLCRLSSRPVQAVCILCACLVPLPPSFALAAANLSTTCAACMPSVRRPAPPWMPPASKSPLSSCRIASRAPGWPTRACPPAPGVGDRPACLLRALASCVCAPPLLVFPLFCASQTNHLLRVCDPCLYCLQAFCGALLPLAASVACPQPKQQELCPTSCTSATLYNCCVLSGLVLQDLWPPNYLRDKRSSTGDGFIVGVRWWQGDGPTPTSRGALSRKKQGRRSHRHASTMPSKAAAATGQESPSKSQTHRRRGTSGQQVGVPCMWRSMRATGKWRSSCLRTAVAWPSLPTERRRLRGAVRRQEEGPQPALVQLVQLAAR